MTTSIVTINPATGKALQQYPSMVEAAIASRVASAAAAQTAWSTTELRVRIDLLLAVAHELERRRDELVTLMIEEVGKPLREAVAEIDKCVLTCRHYASKAPELFEPLDVDGPGFQNQIVFEPLGTILAIMPWNFPFWQVIRCAAPALALGNTIVLKHSPNTTGCALAIEQVFDVAGCPDGVFQTIVVDEPSVAGVVDGLINDPAIAAVTLTGSSRAGAHVAAVAGGALKKSVLELGGSDPFVVLEDADIDRTVAAAVASRFINCGQSCLAAKRIIVHAGIAADFIERFVEATEALVVGDPHDPATQIGPMARRDLRDALAEQVAQAIAAGAHLVVGGHPLERAGWWFAPTVLVDVTDEMSVMTEETFGPVAPIIVADNDDHAIELANNTEYGLGASVWSADIERAASVGSRIRSGALFINAVVASDPRLPFGGIGRSGYGRELGEIGAREFANVRTVVTGKG